MTAMRICTFENGVKVIKEIDERDFEFAQVTEGQVRFQRDELLDASDWTQVADAPVDQAAWATYRQALRDVPSQEGFPADIAWPTKP